MSWWRKKMRKRNSFWNSLVWSLAIGFKFIELEMLNLFLPCEKLSDNEFLWSIYKHQFLMMYTTNTIDRWLPLHFSWKCEELLFFFNLLISSLMFRPGSIHEYTNIIECIPLYCKFIKKSEHSTNVIREDFHKRKWARFP